jgi:hypothetical protein
MCEEGWKSPRNLQKYISSEIHDIYFLIALNQPQKVNIISNKLG